MQLDAKALADATAEIVKSHVATATAPLLRRIEVLEGRPAPEKGEPGEPGMDGVGIADAVKTDGVLILRLTDGTEKQIGQVDGKDGEPGPPPDPETVAGVVRGMIAEPIAEAVSTAVAALPAPERGEPGEKGEAGPMPEPEAVAGSFRELAENIVSEAVAAGIAKLPPPEKGDTGDQGRPGADGADGCGIADLLVDRDGNLVATFSDGRMKNIGPVQGRDGLDGKDGRDGFDLTAFDVEQSEDLRSVTLKFARGDVEQRHELKFPVVLDRGVYKADREQPYETGDSVTWGGSTWIAQRETSAKPDSPDSGWRLSTKRGRDGKDAKAA